VIRPPDAWRAGALVALLLAVSFGTGAVGAAAADATPTGTPGCATDDGDSTLTARASIDASFVDRVTNDSLADWDGGTLVPVGASGDCSLFLGDGETATLTAASVDGTTGVATGSVDLGGNGTLAFVSDSATDIVLRNDGPDYAASLVASAGDRRERIDVETGRFLDFVVRFDDNETRVAVWASDGSWDGDWDARFESTAREERQIRLTGRGFLDELAVGTETPDPTPTATPTAGAGTDGDEDDFDGPTFPDDPSSFDGGDQEPDDPTAEAALFGLLFLVFGGVGVVYPRPVARFGEQLDAIGSTTSMDEVEPTDWNVVLTRVVSVVFVLFGLGLLWLALA
jgi:hypothetical protein